LDQDNAEELMVGGEGITPPSPHPFISQLIWVQMFYCDVYRLLSSKIFYIMTRQQLSGASFLSVQLSQMYI
jgi:hypothetical protein